jgi:HSP20 family molecular chaperone IbpA
MAIVECGLPNEQKASRLSGWLPSSLLSSYADPGSLWTLGHFCISMDPEFKQQASDDGWQVSAQIPGLRTGDLEITVEQGKRLRVVGKQGDNRDAFEGVFDIPPGLDGSQTRVRYLRGELQIKVPKA